MSDIQILMTLLLGSVGLLIWTLLIGMPRLNRWGYGLIFLLPVVHAVADSTTNYFASQTLNTGVLRTLLVAAFLIYAAGRVTPNRHTAPLLAFLGYLFVLSLLSSDPIQSSKIYWRVFFSMTAFLLGFHLIQTRRDLDRLYGMTVLGALVIIGQLAFAQLFRLGESVYVENSFFLGGALAQISYHFVIVVLLMPLFLARSRGGMRRVFTITVTVLSVVAILLIVRRVAYLAVLVGFVTYFVLSPTRTRMVRYLGVVSLLLLVAYPAYAGMLGARLESRLTERSFSEEGRVVESLVVLEEVRNRSIAENLFGTELFNSAAYLMGKSNLYNLLNADRPLHVDFNILLHGAGLVGLLLYLGVHGQIALRTLRLRRGGRSRYEREMCAVALALLAASLVISLSGSLPDLGYRWILYAYLGTFVGFAVRGPTPIPAERVSTPDPAPSDVSPVPEAV